ncbi:MAG TPA: hypothetical protein VGE93_18970 [Bryobacteraceae bacterium]
MIVIVESGLLDVKRMDLSDKKGGVRTKYVAFLLASNFGKTLDRHPTQRWSCLFKSEKVQQVQQISAPDLLLFQIHSAF